MQAGATRPWSYSCHLQPRNRLDNTPRQKETLENLCKAIPIAIWNRVQPDQDIAFEQVVGGNGGKGSFQFSCRKYLAKSID